MWLKALQRLKKKPTEEKLKEPNSLYVFFPLSLLIFKANLEILKDFSWQFTAFKFSGVTWMETKKNRFLSFYRLKHKTLFPSKRKWTPIWEKSPITCKIMYKRVWKLPSFQSIFLKNNSWRLKRQWKLSTAVFYNSSLTILYYKKQNKTDCISYSELLLSVED